MIDLLEEDAELVQADFLAGLAEVDPQFRSVQAADRFYSVLDRILASAISQVSINPRPAPVDLKRVLIPDDFACQSR